MSNNAAQETRTNHHLVFSIVILHGLNGHPQSTWTHDSKFFWPWELKNKVKNARVMVFGYNADVTSSFADNLIRIRDIGRMLVSDLVVERQEDEVF